MLYSGVGVATVATVTTVITVAAKATVSPNLIPH